MPLRSHSKNFHKTWNPGQLYPELIQNHLAMQYACQTNTCEYNIYGKTVLCNVIGLFRLCTSSSSTKNKGIVNVVTLESSKILPCNIVTWCLVSCHLWTNRSIAHTGTLRLYFIMSPLPKAPRPRPCPLFLYEWLFFSLKGQFTRNRGVLSRLLVFWVHAPTLNLEENSSWKD